jgi:hypothetical protein
MRHDVPEEGLALAANTVAADDAEAVAFVCVVTFLPFIGQHWAVSDFDKQVADRNAGHVSTTR